MFEIRQEESKITYLPGCSIIAQKVPEMRDELIQELDSRDWEELIVDCNGVTTIDSIGMNFIVGLFKRTKAQEKKFRITGCNQTVKKVLRVFRLDVVLDMDE
ncbi:STAS domain-containing protein [bacterium]|nr:STAS domain-containing protein [bacterium]